MWYCCQHNFALLHNGIQVPSGKAIQTILYADDQVIIAKSENKLQMAVNKLHKIAKK
jgi:hypothetical protein